ncbi:Uncharacterized conserved protein [Ceraceosorus bombacis]|uniref:Uncharacterized conserved protein n=1 Tax=Ceraceosorus bombacis TaxID=401625 RepID=A0A0N7LAZ0_9BASI|nr:Uncharacterized conserved protein [Ceraceosorus bombacis]
MSERLLSELALLSSESKRKHPDVRTAADAALNALKSDQSVTLAAAKSESIRAYDNVLLRPLLLSCAAKTAPKVTSIAVGMMQRVVDLKAVPESALAEIIDTLTGLVQTRQDVDVHLKALQVVASLVTSYPNIHDDLLSKTLLICFQMRESSKVTAVYTAAGATLSQVVMTVFDKVKEEDAILDGIKEGGEDAAAVAPLAAMTVPVPGSDGITLFPSSKDAYRLLSDLNALASGDEAPFLGLASLPRTFALELIESILKNHAYLFKPANHPELLLSLRQSICPLLIRALSEQPDFPVTLRLVRLLFVLLRQFNSELKVEVEILMSILQRLLSQVSSAGNPAAPKDVRRSSAEGQQASPAWLRILAMEAARGLCSDGELLRNLWRWYDGTQAASRVFMGLVESLHHISVENPQLIGMAEAAHQLSDEGSSKGHVHTKASSSQAGFYNAAAGAVSGLLGTDSSPSSSSASSSGLSHGSVPSLQLLDQLDKTEPPATPNTYLYLLALQSLVCLSQTLAAFVLPIYSASVNSRPKSASRAPPALDLAAYSGPRLAELQLVRDIISKAWTPILSSFTFFLGSRMDEALFSEVLVAWRNFTNTTGVLALSAQRDALLASLAHFAVPRSVVNRVEEHRKAMARAGANENSSTSAPTLSERNAACLKAFTQVAYYLSGSLTWQSVLSVLCDAEFVLRAPRARRSKNESLREPQGEIDALYSPRASMASFSALSSIPPGFTSASALDPKTRRAAAMSNLEPEHLLAEITRVFENSHALDDAALLAFIKALCELCARTVGLERPPSSQANAGQNLRAASRLNLNGRSFALANLEAVVLQNTPRLAHSDPASGWDISTSLYLSVLNDQLLGTTIRLQAAEALDAFLFAAMATMPASAEASMTLASANQDDYPSRITRQVIDVLAKQAILSHKRESAADLDIRRTGLDTLLRVLEAHGHGLRLGWETIFEMCSAACGHQNAGSTSLQDADKPPELPKKSAVPLIKAAFPSLQLVCSDLLALLTPPQLEISIGCLTTFSTQHEEVNVALTANNTLWGITAELSARGERAAGVGTIPDELTAQWMFLLRSLLRVSRDDRSEVRNGAIVNLFRVLEQYGSMLTPTTWSQAVMAEVVYTLFDDLDAETKRLTELSDSIEKAKVDQADETAATMGTLPSIKKQWDESRVLALENFGRVLSQFLVSKIAAVGQADFQPTWTRALRLLRTNFLAGPSAISQAAGEAWVLAASVPLPPKSEAGLTEVLLYAKNAAWQVWAAAGDSIRPAPTVSTFTQANLLAYLHVLAPIYADIGETFDLEQHGKLLDVLMTCVTYTGSPDHTQDIDALTPLQTLVRQTISSLKIVPGLASRILSDLAEYSTLAFTLGTSPVRESSASAHKRPSRTTFVALCKAATEDVLNTFSRFSSSQEIFASGALENTFSRLLVPLKLKYECPPASRHAKPRAAPLWQTATITFCRIAQGTCLALRREGDALSNQAVHGIWKHMLATFEGAFDADCSAARLLSMTEAAEHESIDLVLLSTLEVDVLPFLGDARVPAYLIASLAFGLARASSLYQLDRDLAAPYSARTDSALLSASHLHAENGEWADVPPEGTVAPIIGTPREHFAYWAFDLLFLMCSNGWQDRVEERKRVATLALPALVKRTSLALQSFAANAPLRGSSPPPRIQSEELSYVLSSMLDLHLWPGSLLAAKTFSEHNSQSSDTIEPTLRSLALSSPRAHLFNIYPTLVSLLTQQASAIGTPGPGSVAVAGTSQPLEGIKEVAVPEGLSLGRIGRANPLQSPRLDREGPQEHSALLKACLDVVGATWST